MTKRKKTFFIIVSLLILIAVWEIVSRIVRIDFAIPGVIETLTAFADLLTTASFWKIVFFSILRIFLGFLLGVLFAILITPLTVVSSFAKIFVSLIMTVLKSTPVASFILVIWILIGSANVPTVIAILIVTPIIWQNLYDGYFLIDKRLLEVGEIFKFSRKKKLKYIIAPSVIKFLMPALLSSVGLAWKSGIAAEIISYTKNSIGKEIFDAKSFFEGGQMFAWTLTVVILSLAFEVGIKLISNRYSSYVEKSFEVQK